VKAGAAAAAHDDSESAIATFFHGGDFLADTRTRRHVCTRRAFRQRIFGEIGRDASLRNQPADRNQTSPHASRANTTAADLTRAAAPLLPFDSGASVGPESTDASADDEGKRHGAGTQPSASSRFTATSAKFSRCQREFIFPPNPLATFAGFARLVFACHV
jgi:hypothetical protein